jgi:transposase
LDFIRRTDCSIPARLRREVETYLPQQNACPDCGGELKHLGEDVSEILECVPERVKVIRQVRPKLACAGCELSAEQLKSLDGVSRIEQIPQSPYEKEMVRAPT